MNLTSEQVAAIRQGEAVRVTERDVPLVILRADIYERLRSLVDDDTYYTTAEVMDEIMAEDDAHDPYLAELQKKYPAR